MAIITGRVVSVERNDYEKLLDIASEELLKADVESPQGDAASYYELLNQACMEANTCIDYEDEMHCIRRMLGAFERAGIALRALNRGQLITAIADLETRLLTVDDSKNQ